MPVTLLLALLLAPLCAVPQQAMPDPPKPGVEVPAALADDEPTTEDAPRPDPDADAVRTAANVLGLSFTDAELELMLSGVAENLGHYAKLRAPTLDNGVAPVLTFSPLLPGMTPRIEPPPRSRRVMESSKRPADAELLAFADIDTLSLLIRNGELSCVELTRMYIARLRKLDETLHCVIEFTEERALAQAVALDAEIARGEYRGPLHGIPWGAKDLLATKGARTTWGAKPFEQQELDFDAAVV